MSAETLTPEEHRLRHVELHKALDELLGDFLTHNRDKHVQDSTLMNLIEWSHSQTIKPTERER